MNDQTVGTVRTVVQLVAGWIVSQLVQRWGIEVDGAALELVLLAVATGVYRLAVAALSKRWPWLEWLNGWATKPAYGPSSGHVTGHES